MARKSIHDADALLLYRVGPVYCCSPALTVEAVIMPPHLTHPPGSTIAEPGVFKTVQGIVKAVDLRKRFGVDKEDWNEPGRIIIIEVEGGHAGLWVDDIVDVIQFPQKGWADVPAGIPKNVFSRTLLLNDVVQLYADFEKIYNFKETGYLRRHIENMKSQIGKEKVPSEIEETLKDEHEAVADKKDVQDKVSESITELVNHDKGIEFTVSPAAKSDQVLIIASNDSDKNIKKYVAHKSNFNNYSNTDSKKEKINFKNEKDKNLINKELEKTRALERKERFIKSAEIDSQSNKTNVAELKQNDFSGSYGLVVVGVLFVAVFLVAGYLLLDMPPGLKKEIEDKPPNEIIRQETEVVTVVTNIEKVIEDTGISHDVLEEIENIASVDNQFHADIREDEEGLVIVLTQPDEIDGPVLDLEVEQDKSNDVESDRDEMNKMGLSKENVLNKIKSHEEIKVKVIDAKSKKISKTIVHIVIKGDTLWHIAKRYINNPFRYPELARLSHIENPDLIYPGNKVKIIFKSKISTTMDKNP